METLSPEKIGRVGVWEKGGWNWRRRKEGGEENIKKWKWPRWGKDRKGEQEMDYLDRGRHWGTSKKPDTKEILRNRQR